MFETVKMLASGLGIASKEQTTLYGLPLEQQRLPFDSTQMATCSSFGNTVSICLVILAGHCSVPITTGTWSLQLFIQDIMEIYQLLSTLLNNSSHFCNVNVYLPQLYIS